MTKDGLPVFDEYDSPYEAELQALYWASGYADDKGWNLIEWSSDAAMVVKQIADQSAPPLSWFTYSEMLEIRARFQNFKWSIKWNARSANGVADSLAKKALYGSSVFYFSCNVDVLPRDILSLCALECLSKNGSL
ncbi:hypothetical protein FEM48_Zijuj01G0120000 [Ziziphus jujuba var. spinosa]|uniref:RNase H type-1 domain-containing protein n=1 Tax=Ziziphus jujuba var. spinosa TaxID=714518 RepID=A0A978W150_ZIZJJ|nr:hypothetical protein FEM48_Zijuj01G0120000 [Ziziphus jujuba var. spinosa]